MDELIKIQRALGMLLNNWDRIIHEFLMSFEADFIDIIHSQLERGEDGDGDKLKQYSLDEYTKFKKALGSMSAPIADLKLSGDFYEGMNMNDKFVILSDDWKNDMLIKKYGLQIMEVQSDNMASLIKDQILPEFEAFIRAKLGI